MAVVIIRAHDRRRLPRPGDWAVTQITYVLRPTIADEFPALLTGHLLGTWIPPSGTPAATPRST